MCGLIEPFAVGTIEGRGWSRKVRQTGDNRESAHVVVAWYTACRSPLPSGRGQGTEAEPRERDARRGARREAVEAGRANARQQGTIARSLLSTALDEADPDPHHVTALLDRIAGAFERADLGVAQVRGGAASSSARGAGC